MPETREQFYLRHSIIDDEDIAEWGSYVDPNPKPGSVQRKQLYNKAVCLSLLSSLDENPIFKLIRPRRNYSQLRSHLNSLSIVSMEN